MSLKQKAIHGTKWLMINKILNIGVSFVLSMVLARLLGPTEYGLVGMTTVFTGILNVFVTSGLGSSLIRTKDTTNEDYTTIFYFNIVVCLLAYCILFVGAPYIAEFYDKPILKDVIRVLGITLIIGGLSMVQSSIRTKQINFKIQTIISLISTVFSGILGIFLALKGYGVWSIVWQSVINTFLGSLLFWITSDWRPHFFFSFVILKKHLSYGLHILRSQLTIAISDNIFYFVIGKYYSPSSLGLYTRADTLVNLFSRNIEQTLNSIIFPTLCKINDQRERLAIVFNDFLSVTSFLTAFFTLNFVAVSDNFIMVALGTKWLETSYYMKILVVAAFFHPINTINIRIANVLGRSDVFANAIAFQRTMLIVLAIIGIYTNFETLLYGTIVVSISIYIYNSQKVKKMIGISVSSQIKGVLINSLPSFIGAFMIWILGCFLPFNKIVVLAIQLFFGIILYYFYFENSKLPIYVKTKEMLIGMLKK
jgi:teichuronic acid exporter